MNMFKTNLKILMTKAGYPTNKELGIAVGVVESQVSNWRRGINKPEHKTIEKLLQVLNCTYSDLFGDETEIKPQKVEEEAAPYGLKAKVEFLEEENNKLTKKYEQMFERAIKAEMRLEECLQKA